MTENPDNITATEIIPESPVNCTEETLQGPEAAVHEKNRPLFGHRFGILDYIVFAVVFAGIVANQLVPAGWVRWIIAGACMAALAVPAVVQKIKVRNQFSLMTIFRLFKKMGLNPSLEGDSIAWILGDKRNTIRIWNGNQMQVSREYPLKEDIAAPFTMAATETMNEIFSAKVGVRRNDEDDNIFFATEMFCSSMKEFSRILPETVSILDAAEDRQRRNLHEVIEAEKQFRKKKIGFER